MFKHGSLNMRSTRQRIRSCFDPRVWTWKPPYNQRKFRSQISDNMDRWKSRGGKSQKGIYLWFGARKWIRAPKWIVVTGFFLTEMVKLTWNAEKHKFCWKACFVVTCLFFWWKWRNLHEMLRSTNSAEKHVLLWHVYFFDGNGETYMKFWEAQNLLKSMFCCDMSIFLNGNGETYMKCWEAQNLLKNMFCCDMSIFLMEVAKLTWNAEKQVMLRSTKSAEKNVLLWHV